MAGINVMEECYNDALKRKRRTRRERMFIERQRRAVRHKKNRG